MNDSSSPNVFATLKNIAKENIKKLSGTFSLVAMENLLFLLYPLWGVLLLMRYLKAMYNTPWRMP